MVAERSKEGDFGAAVEGIASNAHAVETVRTDCKILEPSSDATRGNNGHGPDVINGQPASTEDLKLSVVVPSPSSSRDQTTQSPRRAAFGLNALNLSGEQGQRVRGPSGWVYQKKAFGKWYPNDKPRRTAIFLVESSYFDTCIILTIVLNVILMAVQSPVSGRVLEGTVL